MLLSNFIINYCCLYYRIIKTSHWKNWNFYLVYLIYLKIRQELFYDTLITEDRKIAPFLSILKKKIN